MLDELQQMQVSPLVGSHAELAPYLAGLDLDEALVGFERLADLVLTPSPPPADDQQQQQDSLSSMPSSPASASSQWLSSPSSTSFSSVSSSLSFSIYSGSSCSSPNSSAASSVCGDQLSTSGSRRRRQRPSGLGLDDLGRSGGGVQKQQRGERCLQNATAAKRYRRKLKGRRCGLEEELERERERNARLMASFESKLALYREFADLLAANTHDPQQDQELALLGRRSLSNILERICPAQFLTQNERQRVELERLHEHFRRVLSVASALSGPFESGQAQLAY